MGICWIPKSSIAATLGSLFYSETKAKGEKWEEYQEYGLIIQTHCVLSIIILATIGSVGLKSLGPRLLKLDEMEPDNKQQAKKQNENIT